MQIIKVGALVNPVINIALLIYTSTALILYKLTLKH